MGCPVDRFVCWGLLSHHMFWAQSHVDAVTDTRIESQTTMMNKGWKTLVLGSVKMVKINRILAVVTMIVALAAPAMAHFSGSHTVLSGETWAADGDIAKDSNTDITINVGGSMTGGEFQASDGWGYTFDMDIFGAADITEFKIYGAGACTIVVGNGTDPATLTILEGLLGKAGDASITINAGSTMAVSGTWQNIFKVDENAIGSDSYINLVGGTLMVNALDTTVAVNIEPFLKGNGVPGAWVKTLDAGAFDGDGANVYTAAVLVPPGTVFIIQ